MLSSPSTLGHPWNFGLALSLGNRGMTQIFDGHLSRLNTHGCALLICTVLCTLASGVPAAAETYISFDAPGSNPETTPESINDKGDITGSYFDSTPTQLCF